MCLLQPLCHHAQQYPRHGLPQGLKHSTGTGIDMEATGSVTWVRKGACHLRIVGPKGAGGTSSQAQGGPIVGAPVCSAQTGTYRAFSHNRGTMLLLLEGEGLCKKLQRAAAQRQAVRARQRAERHCPLLTRSRRYRVHAQRFLWNVPFL